MSTKTFTLELYKRSPLSPNSALWDIDEARLCLLRQDLRAVDDLEVGESYTDADKDTWTRVS